MEAVRFWNKRKAVYCLLLLPCAPTQTSSNSQSTYFLSQWPWTLLKATAQAFCLGRQVRWFQKRKKLTFVRETLSSFQIHVSGPSVLNCRPQPEPASPVYLVNRVTKLFPWIKSRAPVWRGLLGWVKGGGDSAGCPLFHKLNYWNVLFPPVWYKTRGGALTTSGCFPNPGEDLRRNYKEVGCYIAC